MLHMVHIAGKVDKAQTYHEHTILHSSKLKQIQISPPFVHAQNTLQNQVTDTDTRTQMLTTNIVHIRTHTLQTDYN